MEIQKPYTSLNYLHRTKIAYNCSQTCKLLVLPTLVFWVTKSIRLRCQNRNVARIWGDNMEIYREMGKWKQKLNNVILLIDEQTVSSIYVLCDEKCNKAQVLEQDVGKNARIKKWKLAEKWKNKLHLSIHYMYRSNVM